MTGLLYTLLSPLMVAAYLLLLYLPGYLVLMILGARGILARAAAPALTLVFYAVLGVGFNLVGIPWSLVHVVIAYLLVFGALSVIVRLFSLQNMLSDLTIPNRLWKDRKFLASSFLVLALLFLTFTVTGLAGAIPQHSDSIFHLNGVYTVLKTGNGSIFNALSPLYSLLPAQVTYPSLWHPFVALLATPKTVVFATNAVLMTLPIIWFHSITVFTAIVMRDDPKVMRFVPFVVYLIPISETVITHVIDRWPNGMGVAILPGLLAVSTHVVRLRFPNWQFRPRHELAYPMLLLLLWVGAGIAHPTAIVSLVLMLLPVLVYITILVISSIRRRRLSSRAITHLKIIFIAAGILFLLGSGAIWSRLYQGAPDSISWSAGLPKIFSVFSLYTYWSASIWGDFAIGFVGLFTITGAVWLYVRQRTQWLVFCYIFFFTICLSALVFIPVATSLTSLWFSDSLRMLAILSILAIPLAAQGLRFYVELSQHIFERALGTLPASHQKMRASFYVKMVVCIVVVFAFSGVTLLRATLVYRLYYPPREWHMTQFSEGEYELQQRLGKSLAGQGLVLGEAANGSALLPVTAGIPVALKQQNYSSLDSQGWYLRHYFRDLRIDPTVCKILNRHNINFFYEDNTRIFSEHYLPQRSPGLFNVDTSEGFALIDQSSEVKVWRINVCTQKALPIPYIGMRP